MNLTQKQWHKVLSVIQHMNDSLDDQAVREQAGRDLLDLLSADYFASYVWDDELSEFAKPVYLNMTRENLELYEKYYQFHDPITHKLQPYRRAVSVNEVMKQEDLINTEFFNDFLQKDGLYYGINIYVYDKGDRNIGDFRIWRSRKRDNFTREELKILDLIAPHFRNVMRNISFAKHVPPALELQEIERWFADEYGLTSRELEITMAILEGHADKVICDMKRIAAPTLRTHLRHIFEKVNVRSRAELCSKAIFNSKQIAQSSRSAC